MKAMQPRIKSTVQRVEQFNSIFQNNGDPVDAALDATEREVTSAAHDIIGALDAVPTADIRETVEEAEEAVEILGSAT